MNTKRLLQTIMMLIVGVSIVSCSTYPSRFKCGDAKGLGCTMLHEVDAQIDSGQIEEVYKVKNKKCSGRKCSTQGSDATLKLKKHDKAVLYPNEIKESLENEDNISF